MKTSNVLRSRGWRNRDTRFMLPGWTDIACTVTSTSGCKNALKAAEMRYLHRAC
jgi:hypothetical protein